jgi:hypothetical protein
MIVSKASMTTWRSVHQHLTAITSRRITRTIRIARCDGDSAIAPAGARIRLLAGWGPTRTTAIWPGGNCRTSRRFYRMLRTGGPAQSLAISCQPNGALPHGPNRLA